MKRNNITQIWFLNPFFGNKTKPKVCFTQPSTKKNFNHVVSISCLQLFNCKKEEKNEFLYPFQSFNYNYLNSEI